MECCFISEEFGLSLFSISHAFYTIINFFKIGFFFPQFLLPIEIRTKIYKTTEHPEVATTLANIAQQRSKLGDYQTAMEEFQKVLGKVY